MKVNLKKSLITSASVLGMLAATASPVLAKSYQVQKNDTVWGISQKYGVSIADIEKLNNIDPATHLIYIDQIIKLPNANKTVASTTTSSKQTVVNTKAAKNNSKTNTFVSADTIKINKGDTLSSLAQKFGTSVATLKQLNNLSSDTIYAGETLKIKGTPVVVNNPSKKASSSQTNQTISKQTSARTNVNSTRTVTTTTNTTTTTDQSGNTVKQTAASQAPAGASLTSYALSFVGTPYVWGGSTPAGFDCSGFVQYVFNHFGKSLGRTTYQQQYAGTKISVSQAQAGDLYFWGSYGSAYHVAIALGGGQYVMAPAPGQSVMTGNVQSYTPSFAVRVN